MIAESSNNQATNETTSFIKLSDNIFIKKIDFDFRGNQYCDIILNNNGKEIFIGRYGNCLKNIQVLYNNGKILVSANKLKSDLKEPKIAYVHTLYDILDDTHYSTTQIELLNSFDPSIDSSSLKEPNKIIVRSDMEKRRRMK